jgi:hypothetical protein
VYVKPAIAELLVPVQTAIVAAHVIAKRKAALKRSGF